jgi:hypothetical protein
MKRFPPAVLMFVNDLLKQMYGEPLKLSRKYIYLAA